MHRGFLPRGCLQPIAGRADALCMQAEGRGSFTGTFTDYMQQRTVEQPDALSLAAAEAEQVPEEEVREGGGHHCTLAGPSRLFHVACSPSFPPPLPALPCHRDVQPCTGQLEEARLSAQVCNLQQGHRWCTVLDLDGTAIWGTEHLLAALECCGVDNARIEVEGGKGKLVCSLFLSAWHMHLHLSPICPGVTLSTMQNCRSSTARHWAGPMRLAVPACSWRRQQLVEVQLHIRSPLHLNKCGVQSPLQQLCLGLVFMCW